MNTTQPQLPAVSGSRLRGEMMGKVYRIWLFRRLLPVLIAEIAVIALVLYGFGRAVFVQKVLENAMNVFFQHPAGIVAFFLAAFEHAPVLTKFLTVGVVLFLALIIRHLTQGALRLILVRSNYFSKIK